MDGSVGNPVLRRNELMVQISEYEIYEKQNSLQGAVSHPALSHPVSYRYGKSGDPNPQYDGSRSSDG
jgi:hypothetical protein